MDIPTEIIVIAIIAIIALALGIGFFVTSRYKTLNFIFLLIVVSLIAFSIGMLNSQVIEQQNKLRSLLIPIILLGIANKSRHDTEVARVRVGRRVFTAYVVHIVILIVSILATFGIFSSPQ